MLVVFAWFTKHIYLVVIFYKREPYSNIEMASAYKSAPQTGHLPPGECRLTLVRLKQHKTNLLVPGTPEM